MKMRLPNGFGQISKIKNKKLRNPYRAMVTVGKTPEGKPICKLLKPKAYFRTYNEAYAALVEYNKNPYDLLKNISTNEMFEKWISQHKVHKARITTIKSAWKYCHEVYDVPIRELRVRHIKHVLEFGSIDDRRPSANTQTIIKEVFNMMLDMAIEYELTDKNYARELKSSRIKTSEQETKKFAHRSFSEEEISLMKELSSTNATAAMLLIQCYTGMRPSELLGIKNENVILDEWYVIAGMKTKSGINRTIPLHQCIRDLVKNFYTLSFARGSTLLFDFVRNYDEYRNDMQKLFPNHRPHDPRVHFVTLAKKYNVNEYALKRIVGHKIDDLTEDTYTERSIAWLHSELAKIPNV